MPVRSLIFAICLACAKGISGPTPQVSNAIGEQDQSAAPAFLCNGQGDPAAGWLVDAIGDNFAPLPADTLHSNPGVAMPRVTLTGPETYTLPGAYVRFTDKTRMPLAMRTKDSAADGHELAPGNYSLTVTNLNGASSTLANAIQAIPPPVLVAVSPLICNDRPTRLVILGGNFRPAQRPAISFVPRGGGAAVPVPDSAVTLVAPNEIAATIGKNTFPAGLTGALYTVEVADPAGCAAPYGAGPRGLGVTDVSVSGSCPNLGMATMSPKFGSQQKNQSITIHAMPGKPFTGQAPAVTITAPIKGSAAAVPIPLRRVAFVDANTITAVVPTCSGLSATDATGTCASGIAPGGPYTVDIQDPGGAIGSITGPEGFTVVEPPVIASINPATIDTGGTADLTITSGGTSGANFEPASKPQIVFPAGANVRACDLPINSRTTSVIHAKVQAVAQAGCVEYDPTGKQVPAAGGFALAVGFYVIRVQNTADPAFGDFSGLVMTAPAAAPSNAQAAGATLITARADFPFVQAADDAGNHSVYALGGIDGPMGQAGTNTLASIEMSSITPFGSLAAFQVLGTALRSARHGSSAVSVQVPGDTGYVFVIGGIDSSGAAIATVERAQVLKASDAPVIVSPIAPAAAGSLAPGTWYYRVSAVLAAADAVNPGGETLASDEESVTGTGASSAVLSWRCVPGAVKYRVYRTLSANAASGTERLLAEPAPAVASCAGTNETFTDAGSLTPAGLTPPPSGALGAWVAMPSLSVARGQFGARIAGDRLYVAGGCTGAACNATGGEVPAATGYESSQISVNALGPFASGPIGHARKQNAVSLASNATAPDRVAAGEGWLLIEGGVQGATVLTTTTGAIEVAHAIAGGASQGALTFSDATYNQNTTNALDPGFNFGRYGGWSELASDRLFGFGASAISGNPILFRSGDVCNGSPCLSAASFTGNLRLETTSFTARFLPGATLYGGFVYSAGGLASTTSTTVLSSVDRIPY
ncbi:MAG: hypothetical protein LC689_15370 [Myxococcales bacterium]|nr:hypothetical protein [Myxococcales bacterium]